MYLSFFNLNKKPFQISVDPNFLWMGEMHKEALAMLKYGILDNRGFVMLTGDVGTGKTTLVNALVSKLGPDVITANITNPGLKRIEFLNHLAAAFGFGATYTGKGLFLLDFKLFLEKCNRLGKQVLLIIDEAQRLSPDMLEEIRLLSNIEYQNVKLLNIFFVGQDELNEILERYENRALRQRMTLQYHLEPLSEKETGQFIEHRLKVAGTEEKIFTKNAVREIYNFSKGYPRLTNIICDHAMLAGYVSNKKTIDKLQIRECAEDLKLPAATSPAPQFRKNILTKTGQKSESDDENSYFHLYPIVAGILLFILLVCFFYFPIKAGAYVSDIFDYWIDQINGPQVAVSEQKESEPPPTPQATYKVGEARRSEIGGQRSEAITAGGSEERKSGRAETSTAVGPEVGSQRSEGVEQGVEKVRSLEVEDMGDLSGLQPVIQTASLPSDFSSIHPGLPESQLPIVPSIQRPNLPASQPPIVSSSHHFSQNPITDSEKNYTLTFEFDSNDLSEGSYKRLDTTASIMAENPKINLTIKGYTDGSGEIPYNVMLSKFRADIVKNYLVTKGVEPERITAIGEGGKDPIADNSTYEGRRANRRVELEMIF